MSLLSTQLNSLVAATKSIGGNTGGYTAKISTTPALGINVAYSSLDNVGGIVKIPDAVRIKNGTAIIEDIIIWDKDNQKATFQIDFWSASPSAGTYTDNSAQVIAGDQGLWLGSFPIAAADYVTTGTVATVVYRTIGLAIQPSVLTSTDIFYTLKDITTTPTYTVATSLIVKFGILQD